MDRLSVPSCDDFPCLIVVGIFCDHEIAQFHLFFVSGTETCHGSKTGTKLIQDRLEIETCPERATVGQPGDENCERLTILVLDRGVSIDIAAHMARYINKRNSTTSRKFVDYCARFFI